MNTTETTMNTDETNLTADDTGELLPGTNDTDLPADDAGFTGWLRGEMPSSEELNNNEAARAAAAAARAAISNKASESAQKIAAQREQAKAEKAAKAAAEKAEKAAKAATAKAEREAKAAAEKAERDAKASAEKAAAEKVLLDNHASLLAEILCPYCASGDITLDDEQGAEDEGKYYYCHACDTSYACADGSLRPPAEVVAEHSVDLVRSVAASKSWDDAAIREARSQRNGCNVVAPDGSASSHPSVYKAFLALNLPVAKHQKFRKELKAAQTLKFGDFTFTVI